MCYHSSKGLAEIDRKQPTPRIGHGISKMLVPTLCQMRIFLWRDLCIH